MDDIKIYNKQKKENYMSSLMGTGLIVKRETIYDKIRKYLLIYIYQEDYFVMQRLDELINSKRQVKNLKVVIPKEIGKSVIKY